VSGWQLSVLIVARTRLSLAMKVVQDQEQKVLWRRALHMQTPARVGGATRRRRPGFDKRCRDGMDQCRPDPQGITGLVLANANRAATADARTQATAGQGMTIGCWVLDVNDDAYRIFPEGSP
jgi:hypothetical protein